MKILIVGGGGREHALAWRCAQSTQVSEVLVAPGNAGTASEDKPPNIDVSAEDIDQLLVTATREHVDLTIVGPEQPLVAGIADAFKAAGLACFGPSAAASALEASKAFSKAFLERHGIPTGAYQRFSDFEAAKRYIEQQGAPIVIKADGLAAGKGVVVATSIDEAVRAAEEMLVGARFGDASREIVVEEFLAGEEASFIAITDGTTLLPLATSQDHKARDNGDTGPNTGGMGAYSPAPVVTPEIERHIIDDIMQPTLDGLRRDGIDYVGFLYAGLMIRDGRASVLEFNCRMGDPETQPIMRRLRSDLPDLAMRAIAGELAGVTLDWDPRAAVGVVMAAGGYPANYEMGHEIKGLDAISEDTTVFHAGTTRDDAGRTVTAGGRVLCVTALGDSVAQAAANAYADVDRIHWQNSYHRTDIGHRAIARERADR